MAKVDKRRNPVILQQGMKIGHADAADDRDFLIDCFVHYPPVELCRDPTSPGMILRGRTGAGKTAILQYISDREERVQEIDPFEMSMDYVANSDILNFVQTIGGDLDLLFQILWKHVLCIEYIRLKWKIENLENSRSIFAMFSERFGKDARRKKAIDYLKAWEDKFWITMDQNVKEITVKVEDKLEAELGVDVKKIKARGQYDKQLSRDKKIEIIQRTKKIIDPSQLSDLAEVINILHQQEIDPQKTYYILIDKLDERWVDTSLRFRLIRALIESLKALRRITDLKIIVALRTDVLERVVQENTDTSFQREKYEDYFVQMKWTKALLLELVRKRVRTLFRKKYSPNEVVEFSDVFRQNVGKIDPFEYMVERTLMRPRDIINFVNICLQEAEGNYEVTGGHIKKAEKEYSRVRRETLEQEWNSAFPTLKKMLDFISTPQAESFSLETLLAGNAGEKLALDIAADRKIDFDPVYQAANTYVEHNGDAVTFVKEVLSILYRVGAIGIKLRPTDRMSYSHIDEPVVSPTSITDSVRIKVHPMLHAALRLVPGTT